MSTPDFREFALMLARKRSASMVSSSTKVSASPSLTSIIEVPEPAGGCLMPTKSPSPKQNPVDPANRGPSTSVSSNQGSTSSSSPSTSTGGTVTTTIAASITSVEEIKAASTGRDMAELIFSEVELRPASKNSGYPPSSNLSNVVANTLSEIMSNGIVDRHRSVASTGTGSMFGGTTVYDESRFATLVRGASKPTESIVTSMQASAGNSEKTSMNGSSVLTFPARAYRPTDPIFCDSLHLVDDCSTNMSFIHDPESQEKLAFEKEMNRLRKGRANGWTKTTFWRGTRALLVVVAIVMLTLGAVGGWVYFLRLAH